MQSPPCSEKTLFAYQFIKKGLETNQCGIIIISTMNADELRTELKKLNLNIDEYEKKDRVRIIDWFSFKNERIIDIEVKGTVIKSSRSLTNVKIGLNQALKAFGETVPKVAVIDILSQALELFEFENVYKFVETTRARFKKENCTALFLIDKETIDSKKLSALHQIFDGIINIEKVREGDNILAKIGISAMSGTRFQTEYKTLAIREKEGLFILEKKEESLQITTDLEQEKKSENTLTDDKSTYERLLSEGEKCIINRKYDEALQILHSLTREYPENAKVLLRISQVYRLIGNEKKRDFFKLGLFSKDNPIEKLEEIIKDFERSRDYCEKAISMDKSLEEVCKYDLKTIKKDIEELQQYLEKLKTESRLTAPSEPPSGYAPPKPETSFSEFVQPSVQPYKCYWCNLPLQWIQYYQRWYCYKCRRYA